MAFENDVHAHQNRKASKVILNSRLAIFHAIFSIFYDTSNIFNGIQLKHHDNKVSHPQIWYRNSKNSSAKEKRKFLDAH